MFAREKEFKDILRSIGRSENTIKAYSKDLALIFEHGDELSSELVQTTVYAMIAKGSKPASIRRFLSSVKTYCTLFGISIAFARISKPKVIQKEASFITKNIYSAGIGTILADDSIGYLDKEFRSLLFDFLYKTGMRVSELLNLTQEAYNRENNYIQIVGKGNKQRKIPIHHSLVRTFDLDWFFSKLNTTPYNTVLFWTKKYFGKRFSPHSFRHGFTTNLVKKGVSERSVQKVLGHESFVTTLRYFHMNHDEIQKEVLSALED